MRAAMPAVPAGRPEIFPDTPFFHFGFPRGRFWISSDMRVETKFTDTDYITSTDTVCIQSFFLLLSLSVCILNEKPNGNTNHYRRRMRLPPPAPPNIGQSQIELQTKSAKYFANRH